MYLWSKNKPAWRFISLLLALAVVLVYLPNFKAYADDNEPTPDFSFSQSATTVPTTGGEVVLTTNLPAGFNLSGYKIKFDLNEAKKIDGLQYSMNYSSDPNHKDWANLNPLDINNVIGVVNTRMEDVKYTTTVAAVELKVTIPAGLPSGTVINIPVYKDASMAGNNKVYFNQTNSKYKNGDFVAFTIKVQDPDVAPTDIYVPMFSGKVGVAIEPVQATQTGGTPGGTWSAKNLPTGLEIDPVTGIISGTPTEEGSWQYTITYTTPNDKLSSEYKGTMTVGAAPDKKAEKVTVPEITGTFDTPITPVTATQTGGTEGGTWSAEDLPAGLTIDPATGVISGTPTESCKNKYFTVAYSTPNDHETTYKSNVANIAEVKKQITVTFKIVDGKWSDGTTADVKKQPWTINYKLMSDVVAPTGMIPDRAGAKGAWNAEFADYFTNGKIAEGTVLKQDLTFTYTFTNEPDKKATRVTAANITATEGVAITAVTAAQTGGTTGGTWSAAGLPAGLTIDPATGVISGTTSATGVHVYKVTYTTPYDKLETTSAQYKVTVNDKKPTTITASDTVKGIVGQEITPVTPTQNGTPGGTWTISKGIGTLTSIGLSLDPATGEISGMPERAGNYEITVKYTTPYNKYTVEKVIRFEFNDTAATSIEVPAIEDARAGVKITPVTAKQNGGTEGGTWRAEGLPQGITINEFTGVISGTSAKAGEYKFTVTYVTPGYNRTTSDEMTLVVAPAPDKAATKVTAPAITGERETVAIKAVKATQTGGTPGGTWTAAGLPDGLTIDPATGIISGTPTKAETYTYTVTYTTPNDHLATTSDPREVKIGIKPDTKPTTITPTTIGGIVGAPFSQQFTANGTQGGTWSETGLPKGLTLDKATGIISGTLTKEVKGTIKLTYTTPNDSKKVTANVAYSFVKEPDVPAQGVMVPAINGTFDTAIEPVYAGRIGGTDGGTWSAEGLPKGLTIDAKTGKISGTPAESGEFTYTVTYTTPNSGEQTSNTGNVVIEDLKQVIKVTLKIANGAWDNSGDKDPKVFEVRTTNYKLDETTPVPAEQNMVPDKANAKGRWNTNLIKEGVIPVGTELKGDKEFTYTFSTGGGGGGSSSATQYTVKFMDGDKELSSAKVNSGSKVTKPADPSKDWYFFNGWFTDKECKNTYDFNKAVNADLTLYAGYTPHKCLAFTDIDGHWARNSICYVVEKDLFNGTSDTLFSPNTEMSRAMLVTVLWRLEGKPAGTTGTFQDLTAGAYYVDAINWANANGIVKGYDENTFGPNDNITREQMAAIMARYAAYKGYDTTAAADLSKYTDQGSISEYAYKNMQWANAVGVITGVTDTTLVPQGNATRAEVASILHRFIENIAK